MFNDIELYLLNKGIKFAGIGEKIEKRGKSTAQNEKNSLEPQGFKRVSLGGE